MVLLYCINLFILTCTENFTGLIEEGKISFHWIPNPDYMKFLNMHSYSFQEPSYIFQKAGHCAAFLILAVVVYWMINNMIAAFSVSVIFAIFTEVMQLHFSRTGCLLDVGYDTIGILCGLLICKTNGMTIAAGKKETERKVQ